MNRKGFTLIELILVIAILGILAVVAFPKFIDLATSARQSTRDGVVGSIRAGLEIYRANNLAAGGTGAFPASLDTNSSSGLCNSIQCFDSILSNPITDGSWNKASSTSYLYQNGTINTSYTYNATNGTFE